MIFTDFRVRLNGILKDIRWTDLSHLIHHQ